MREANYRGEKGKEWEKKIGAREKWKENLWDPHKIDSLLLRREIEGEMKNRNWDNFFYFFNFILSIYHVVGFNVGPIVGKPGIVHI